MKRPLYLILILLLSYYYSAAQSPNWLWAQMAPAFISTGMATDASGDVYVTGYFGGVTATIGNVTLTNSDNTGQTDDIFIAKFNSSGNLVWAKGAGGVAGDYSSSISVDSQGNVYIGGSSASDTIRFGAISIANGFPSAANSYYSKVFLAKYNSSGSAIWAKTTGDVYGVNNVFGVYIAV